MIFSSKNQQGIAYSSSFFTYPSHSLIEAEEGEDLLRIRQKDLKPIVPVLNAERVVSPVFMV